MTVDWVEVETEAAPWAAIRQGHLGTQPSAAYYPKDHRGQWIMWSVHTQSGTYGEFHSLQTSQSAPGRPLKLPKLVA